MADQLLPGDLNQKHGNPIVTKYGNYYASKLEQTETTKQQHADALATLELSPSLHKTLREAVVARAQYERIRDQSLNFFDKSRESLRSIEAYQAEVLDTHLGAVFDAGLAGKTYQQLTEQFALEAKSHSIQTGVFEKARDEVATLRQKTKPTNHQEWQDQHNAAYGIILKACKEIEEIKKSEAKAEVKKVSLHGMERAIAQAEGLLSPPALGGYENSPNPAKGKPLTPGGRIV